MKEISFSGKTIMYAAIMAVTVYSVILGMRWPIRAGLFPIIVSSVVLILASIELGFSLFKKESADDTDRIDFKLSTDVDKATANRKTVSTLLWLGGFLFGVILFGLPAAIPLFLFFYLKFESKEGWIFSFMMTFVFWGFFYFLFIWLLKIQFPEGALLGLT
ncbi:MAG: tripartite tricarboxylate transporter TctB family protein [Deltaproteobacteria bacterium]|nr:tripartite tricarboxylate transporter TctB family protein [Deltaproteobacteria bacterium]